MKYRTLALALALGFGLAMGAEAKKRTPVAHHPRSRVVKVKKYKGHKIKHSKMKVARARRLTK